MVKHETSPDRRCAAPRSCWRTKWKLSSAACLQKPTGCTLGAGGLQCDWAAPSLPTAERLWHYRSQQANLWIFKTSSIRGSFYRTWGVMWRGSINGRRFLWFTCQPSSPVPAPAALQGWLVDGLSSELGLGQIFIFVEGRMHLWLYWLCCVCVSADERIRVWEAAAAAVSHAKTSLFQHESRCFFNCTL